MKVKELIKALKKYDQERDICILDADTEWILNIQGLIVDMKFKGLGPVLCVYGDYDSMYKDKTDISMYMDEK